MDKKTIEIIKQVLNDWKFGVQTQSGEDLKVIDVDDFDQILIEIKQLLLKDKVKESISELKKCIKKATPRLSKIKDIDKYLDEIKGRDT